MCVNLGRVDRSVTEELLDRANISAISKEIRSKDVTEGVGRDDVCDTRPCDI